MLGIDELKKLLEDVNQVAILAGERIMEIYATNFEVEQKADKSPLTMADMAAHNTIVERLQKITPDWPILSEESAKIPFQERSN
ncbi:MAG: hypothetical protein IMF12_01655, partial [Proteobacteria bacterium]|nr:hypothetical protein [Pseudomonadota bacterium]